MKLPWLSETSNCFYPTNGRCPTCGSDFSNGFSYLSGGGLLLSADGGNSIQTERLKGFLDIGFHGRDPAMRDSGGFDLVKDVPYGQFDLHWCSIDCMRKALNQLLDDLETKLADQTQSDDDI